MEFWERTHIIAGEYVTLKVAERMDGVFEWSVPHQGQAPPGTAPDLATAQAAADWQLYEQHPGHRQLCRCRCRAWERSAGMSATSDGRRV